MWLVELLLLSVVGGAILGIGLHAWDTWRERVKEEARLEARLEAERNPKFTFNLED